MRFAEHGMDAEMCVELGRCAKISKSKRDAKVFGCKRTTAPKTAHLPNH